MKLLPAFKNRLNNQRSKAPCEPENMQYTIKKSKSYYLKAINVLTDQIAVQNMLILASQLKLSHIGLSMVSKYNSPIDLTDPRSINPLLLSVGMVEPQDNGDGKIYRFVLDLRQAELINELPDLLQLPVTFVCHQAKELLFCIWQLGLNNPDRVWDIAIFEKALDLGKYNKKYSIKKSDDENNQIQIIKNLEEQELFRLSIVGVTQRYGLSYSFECSKKRLQESFKTHDNTATFSNEQIKYALENAVAAAKVYPLQIEKAVERDILSHCIKIEMPWIITNARIEWNGVRIDYSEIKHVTKKITSIKKQYEKILLEKFGIKNVQSYSELYKFFSQAKILNSFKKHGRYCFDKDILKQNYHLHSAIQLIQETKKAQDCLSNKIMHPEFIGNDGRIHACHIQLGADTGRQTCRNPNLHGINKILRPLIIPEENCGIGEADYCQMEIGVAAAMFNDQKLIEMFNTGDVYSAMAQNFYKDELPDALALSGVEFKKKYPEYRKKMKSCTLGLLYGMTAYGLAAWLGISIKDATVLQQKFIVMFPQIKAGFDKISSSGAIRGYTTTTSGLKRYRAKNGTATKWEKNWLGNHPVQGSAATIFKTAGNRLDKIYQQYNAKIIIPLHDSFIFEAPLNVLVEVANKTKEIMCNVFQEFFPVLNPKVDVNISKPHCWNKDGRNEAMRSWIEEANQKIIMFDPKEKQKKPND